MLLMAYIQNPEISHIRFFQNHKGSNLCLISQEVARSVPMRFVHNPKALPTSMVKVAIYAVNHAFSLGLRKVTVVNNMLEFFLVPVIMPDDVFHHRFAEKYYGQIFAHLVTFEKLPSGSRTPQVVPPDFSGQVPARLQ